MFPTGFVVCGFHVITPTNEDIDHMKTTAINLAIYVTVAITCSGNAIRMMFFNLIFWKSIFELKY